MCWVIPPASPATTLALRIWSSNDVLPWSTWPIMVTMGERNCRSSSLSSSSSSSISICFSMSMNSTSKPNSLATSSITSASNRWLIETMMPSPIHLLITSAKLTSIRLANSLTLMNSVTCSLLSSTISPCASAASCLFSRRIFAFRLLPLPPAPASLACVSFIFS